MADENYLFMKSYKCPCCDADFKSPTVKSGKTRTNGADLDLRPHFVEIDSTKYEVISCPYCGYSTMSRFWGNLSALQKEKVWEVMDGKFVPNAELATRTYADGMEAYKLALLTSTAAYKPESEKAYIYLKSAWMLRGWQETLVDTNPDLAAKLHTRECDFLVKALEGFETACTREEFPMCGMDSDTMNYLQAALNIKTNRFDVATRLISAIMSSPTASPRIKDKARDLKEECMTQKKKFDAAQKAQA